MRVLKGELVALHSPSSKPDMWIRLQGYHARHKLKYLLLR